jgi:hypothetical protein
MGVKESTKKTKIEAIHKVISSQIYMADDIDDLTLLAIIYLTSAKQILLSNHGSVKTQALLELHLAEFIKDNK